MLVTLKTVSTPVNTKIDKTSDLLTIIGKYAGTCTDRFINNPDRALRCAKQGHWSVFEHVSCTWDIMGISRACSHQLVRHRMASYTQQSQRYTRIDPLSKWFVAPPNVDEKRFGGMMHTIAVLYEDLLAMGVKPEDARYVLPNATKTNIIVTMNLRELLHFYKERAINSNAQWEIRELANEMCKTLLQSHKELIPVFQIVKERA